MNLWAGAAAALVLALAAGCERPPEEKVVTPPPDEAKLADDEATPAEGRAAEAQDPYALAADKAVDFILANQNEDGGFGKYQGQPASSVGVTGLVTAALLDSPRGLTETSSPEIAKAVQFIVKNQLPDGSIMIPGKGYANYDTSAAVMALVRTENPAYKEVLKKAEDFIRGIQLDEGEGVAPDNPFSGGVGYTQNKDVSDMSNTGFALEAMHEMGLDPEDPFFKKAMVFVKRVSNNPEINDQEWARGENVAPKDFGGSVYRPAPDPSRDEVDISKAGKGTTGWRSYGSMTYHAFKSYIYAGLKKDDPAVKGALGWIEKNYTVEENPGKGKEGQYYYYRVFAKALEAWGAEEIAGNSWAQDLADKLVSLQKPDGSWMNDEARWQEGDATLVTAYSLDAISRAMKAMEKN
jgi:squalene-hopene/tetraprenyl-beta-curcumene cyclase